MGINGIKSGCDFPLWMQYMLVIYMISFIVLFGNFYAKAYIEKVRLRSACGNKTVALFPGRWDRAVCGAQQCPTPWYKWYFASRARGRFMAMARRFTTGTETAATRKVKSVNEDRPIGRDRPRTNYAENEDRRKVEQKVKRRKQ